MFQYAAAYSLAIRKGLQLKLDLSAFTNYKLHNGFELYRVFNCHRDIAKYEDMHNLLGWQARPQLRNLLSRYNLMGLRSKKLALEPSFSYWTGIEKLSDNCYLAGYWQSEKYFSDANTQIRKEFTFRQPLNKINTEVASLISQVKGVSLHVRRGDYASNTRNTSTHGLCSIDYYHKAIQHIVTNVPSAHIFVFSDDIPWVKKNLKLELPSHYVDHNRGIDSFNDMRLMSMCKHHIIANSSFSWWGAWLNPSLNKIVIAPKPWFDKKKLSDKDLFPKNWILYDK